MKQAKTENILGSATSEETVKITVKRQGQRVTLEGPTYGKQSRYFDTEAEAITCYEAVKEQIESGA